MVPRRAAGRGRAQGHRLVPSGRHTDQDWSEWFAKSSMVFLNGDALRSRGRKYHIRDDSFLLLFNAHTDTVRFTVPAGAWGARWEPVRCGALADRVVVDDPEADLKVCATIAKGPRDDCHACSV